MLVSFRLLRRAPSTPTQARPTLVCTMQTNAQGQKLQCSHFLGRNTRPEDEPPITVYCHCNSGSRRDAEEAVYALLPDGITVFAFDFAVRCTSGQVLWGCCTDMLEDSSSAFAALIWQEIDPLAICCMQAIPGVAWRAHCKH